MELVLEMIHLIASWVNRADPELGSAPNHQPPSLGGGSSREKDSLIYRNKESARLCSYTKMHLNKTSNRMDDRPLFSANTLQAELSPGLELRVLRQPSPVVKGLLGQRVWSTLHRNPPDRLL